MANSIPSAPSVAAGLAAQVAARKNIILILTDQQRSLQWFPPGWEEANLPAMTFLRKHGISFNQAVCNTCACTPSRNCTFTGTYPTKNLTNFTLTEFFQPDNTNFTAFNIPSEDNQNEPTGSPYPTALSSSEIQLDQTLPNLATILADAGYDTFYKGKYHLSKGVLGYDNNYYDPDATRYGFQRWDAPDAGQDAQTVNYGGGNANNDARFTEDAVAFLKDRVANAGSYSRPFCLVFSLVNPHDVLGFPMNWDGRDNNGGYTPEALKGKVGLPPTLDENLIANYKPTCQEAWLRVMGSLKEKEQKPYVNFYGNLMKAVDQQIMQVINVLLESPGRKAWADTLIIRTSDHGEMGLTHSGMRQKWFNVYQETLRVPLIWSNPVMFPRAVESDALVSHVDLLPTIASVCGVSDLSRYGLQGFNYSSLFTNPTGKVQDYTYFINTDVKAGQAIPQAATPPNNIGMVRDAQFKYARYYGGTMPDGSSCTLVQEEFYNLATDVVEGTQEAVELHNKSKWALQRGAPWVVTPEEEQTRSKMETLLAKAMNDGVLAPQSRTISPLPMKPRVKAVPYAWTTPAYDVYQVIFYSQHSYTYTLQVLSGGTWVDVAPVDGALIPTTLSGNNGPQLFQPQPVIAGAPQPSYRVARLAATGETTYETVAWEDYSYA